MLRFLTNFRLATRVYGGFLIVGVYVVLLSFAAMYAVGIVHGEYTKANGVIETSRQLNTLEKNLYSLNQSLFFFAVKGSDVEKRQVNDAFQLFKDQADEIKASLNAPEFSEQYTTLISDITGKYQSDLDEMLALYEKSVEAAEKVEKYASQSSEKLTSMIDEVSLPSASFALNALREQLDVVLRSLDAAMEKEDARKQLSLDLAGLKKSINAAKNAEMVNTKQLKLVTATLGSLDDEINRKLKIDDALRDKIQKITAESEKVTADFNGLIIELGNKSTDFLSKAEADKIALQKLFVLAAAFGGALVVIVSFLALFGIRYPLNRLIDNASDIARGNRSVLIHFTERSDEIGCLARSLSLLSAHLKELPVLSDTALLGRPNTYGAPLAYVPLGAANAEFVSSDEAKDEADVAYFGQGAGVDTESQLCQMLALIQHISATAATMSKETNERLTQCQNQLVTMAEALLYTQKSLQEVVERSDLSDFEAVKDNLNKVFSFLNMFLSTAENMRQSADTVVQSSNFTLDMMERANSFVSDLFEWARITVDLTMQIQKIASETKILALNASIEAAKVGPKAKSFGTVALDIRHHTQKTEDSTNMLLDRLKAVQQGAYNFAEVIEKTANEVQTIARYASSSASVANEQAGQINQAMLVLQSVNEETAALQTIHSEMLPQLKDLPAHLNDAEKLVPFMERQLSAIEEKFEGYIETLPTYEEESDPLGK